MKSDDKKKTIAKKMSGNPPGLAARNNRMALEIDRHNRSWNGKEYAYKKGKGSLNIPKGEKNEGNRMMEGPNENNRQ